MIGTIAVEASQVRKSFPPKVSPRVVRPELNGPTQDTAAVSDVSFRILQGERFVIAGPSGSGKTTLLRLIATLTLPDSGSIHVFGHDAVHEPMSVQRLVGYVPVDTPFFKKLSPLDNLLYGAGSHGINTRTAHTRIEGGFQSLGLDVFRHTDSIAELPPGMQLTVAIVRALLKLPAVLLLDEPARHLDPSSKRELLTSLKALNQNEGTTLLLATRDVNLVDGFCHHAATLDGGRISTLSRTGEQMELAVSPGEKAPG